MAGFVLHKELQVKQRRWRTRTNKKKFKENSTTFFLEQAIINALEEIADFENQSKSIIVQCGLDLERTNDDLHKIKKRNFKAKKKILHNKSANAFHKTGFQEARYFQECLF